MNKFRLNIYNALSIILSLFFVYGLVIIINDFDEIFSNISKVNVFIIMSATFVYFISVFFSDQGSESLKYLLVSKE